MVSASTIALFQTVVALGVVIALTVLQFNSWLSVNRSGLDQPEIADAQKYLLISMLTQTIAILLMFTATIMIFIYHKQLQQHSSLFIYGSLTIAILIMLVGGSFGAAAALKLQCLRNNSDIEQAWKAASLTALISTIGPMFILLIQTFANRETVAKVLQPKAAMPPVVSARPEAPRPDHHPRFY
jgi:cytochrome bd-type quinol oxidase subunit 2